ncbi:MAG TPA: type II toxin-antitoxin system PemK/MazF family toxin [Candidatus Ventricola intestinavium]|nr:type II toxin-antitoxin system PemK/MazF family toxin [Candidatus Ventricola intestinavium]
MEVNRGDIFIADLNPVVGSEQGGVRPVVIVQNNRGNRFSPTVICAAMTSRLDKSDLPTHVWVSARDSGLKSDSLVLCEQIRTLEKQRLRTRAGRIDGLVLRRVDHALLAALGIGRN